MPAFTHAQAIAVMASMEPLFFKAENVQERNTVFKPTVVLQWSRFFSKRKILPKSATKLNEVLLQWSRFFSKRKIGEDCGNGFEDAVWLQWSRFFSKRKMVSPPLMPSVGCSFNGAAFFQSGKSPRKSRTGLRLAKGFNGAAFFQSGKCQSGLGY